LSSLNFPLCSDLDILQNILSLDDDLDSDYSTESESSENDEDHEVDDHRTQRKVKRTQAKKIDPICSLASLKVGAFLFPTSKYSFMPKYPLSEDIASYEPLIKDRISVQTKDGLYFLMSLGATDL
jgi:hypothetical protein